MSEPRTFHPEDYCEMVTYLAEIHPDGVTVTNADGSVTVTVEAVPCCEGCGDESIRLTIDGAPWCSQSCYDVATEWLAKAR